MTQPPNAERPSPALRDHPPAPLVPSRAEGGDPPTSRTARRLLSNPGFRRHWKIEQFPPEIRQLIFDGYAAGKSYRQIREKVLARGHYISKNALCRYWRYRWLVP